MKIYNLIQIDKKKKNSTFSDKWYAWSLSCDSVVPVFLTNGCCYLSWSARTGREEERCLRGCCRVSGEYSEFFAGVHCCSLWGGTRLASVRSRSPPPSLEKIKNLNCIVKAPLVPQMLVMTWGLGPCWEYTISLAGTCYLAELLQFGLVCPCWWH